MTQIITCFKNQEVAKRFKIHKSIFEEGFRILVDTPRYGKKNESVVDKDGKSDRIFSTTELAAEFVFGWIDKAMRGGMVDEYTNEYRK